MSTAIHRQGADSGISGLPLFISAVLFLGVATLLAGWAYQPGLSGGFLFDDGVNIVNNPFLKTSELDLNSLHQAVVSGNAGLLKRPISMISFSLNYWLWGEDPYFFKLVNLGIHVLVGGGLFVLTLLLFEARARTSGVPWRPRAATVAAAFIALLWLLHPLNLTGVLYIVQRMASLSALFMVLGLCVYVWGRLRTLDGRGGYSWMFAGSLAATVLAMLSKENGALLPVFLGLLELGVFRFRDANGGLDRRVLVFFAVILLLPALTVVGLSILSPGFIIADYAGRDFNLQERVLTQGRALVFYLEMLVRPRLSELGLYHDDFVVSSGLLSPPTTLAALAAIAGLLLGGFWCLLRYPLVGLGILWFFAAHLLESTVFALEMVHEHRNYLASYGPILAGVSALFYLAKGRWRTVAVLAATGGALLWLAQTTHLRAQQWSNPFLHSSYEARNHPNSARANYSAGHRYGMQALNGVESAAAVAFDYLERTRRVDGKSIMAHFGLITLSYGLNTPLKPEWLAEVESRLANKPFHAGTVIALMLITRCQKSGDCRLPEGVMRGFFRAMMRNPSYADPASLGAHQTKLLATYGNYLIDRKDYTEAGQRYAQAAAGNPEDPEYRWMWARALMLDGRYPEAGEQLKAARKLDPSGLYSERVDSLWRLLSRLEAGAVDAAGNPRVTDSD